MALDLQGLDHVLGKISVEPSGEAFNPELHQAMAEQPAPEGVAPGTVIQAWSAAWTLNGRLLKPAMVVVAAGEAKPDAA